MGAYGCAGGNCLWELSEAALEDRTLSFPKHGSLREKVLAECGSIRIHRGFQLIRPLSEWFHIWRLMVMGGTDSIKVL